MVDTVQLTSALGGGSNGIVPSEFDLLTMRNYNGEMIPGSSNYPNSGVGQLYVDPGLLGDGTSVQLLGNPVTGAETGHCIWLYTLPELYVAGHDITITARALLDTSSGGPADPSASTNHITLEAYRLDQDGVFQDQPNGIAPTTPSAHLTSTPTDYSFTITGTDLVPGTQIFFRLALAVARDAAGTGTITGIIRSISVS